MRQLKYGYLAPEHAGLFARFMRWMFNLVGWKWMYRFGWHLLTAGVTIEAGTVVYVDNGKLYPVEAGTPGYSSTFGVAITGGYTPVVIKHGIIDIEGRMTRSSTMPVYQSIEEDE